MPLKNILFFDEEYQQKLDIYRLKTRSNGSLISITRLN